LHPYAAEFLEEVSTFPNTASRDLVDTMTQSLLKLKDGKYLLNPKDERPQPPNETESKIVY
jgi:phage terminase large subunit-like protein